MPVVYADMLVALNWLIDFLLLSAAACFLHIPTVRWRVVTGALIGGVYALVLLLPPFPVVIRLLLDAGVASLMAVVAFPRSKKRVLVKRVAVFFLISTMFSGMVSLLCSHTIGEYAQTNNGHVYADISPLMLTVFTAVSYVLVRVFERITNRRMPKHGEYRVTIQDEGTEYEVCALFDSGMHLREPFSGAPVMVMERKHGVLPNDIREALDGNKPHPRVRWIPYRTVSGEGLLPAFRPRSVHVKRLGEDPHDVSGVYVALCERLDRGEYEALINNDCCEGWDK